VLGTDQHVGIDPFAELQGLEGGERLRSGRRGSFPPADLLAAATGTGYRLLGWPGGGIALGAPCDLTAVATGSPRTAGARLDQLWLAASAADVTDVVVAGEHVVAAGRHRFGDVGAELAAAIAAVRDPEEEA
jgi:cytosine/adenosine deaminase-related metal-dependent hydrolase